MKTKDLTKSLLMLSVLCLASTFTWAEPVTFTIPELVLWSPEFVNNVWGGSVVRSYVPEHSVLFDFTGLSMPGVFICDSYPVSSLYGQKIPSHGSGDFSAFDGYSLMMENLNDDNIWGKLFINTGFTGPSGIPHNDTTNDTF